MANKKYILIFSALLLGIGTFLGVKYYLAYIKTQSMIKDAEKQVDSSLITNKNLDRKSFTDKLPYISSGFDINYSSINNEVQVVMKNKGLTFEDAKKRSEADVNKFLQYIGVDLSTQKIVWLLAQ